MNLYRVAQEALTNARRHGGPVATADVRLRYSADAIELEVSNDGRGHLVGRPGLGLVGMRERATASGGTLEAGPRSRGGFLVRLRVPLPLRLPDAKTTADASATVARVTDASVTGVSVTGVSATDSSATGASNAGSRA